MVKWLYRRATLMSNFVPHNMSILYSVWAIQYGTSQMCHTSDVKDICTKLNSKYIIGSDKLLWQSVPV